MSDVRKANFEIHHLNVDDAYEHITKTFRAIVDKHAPLKTKILRRNTAPFMNRDLRKGIYTRSRLQKKLKKYSSRENEAKFNKQRNKCVSLRKKAIRNHFKNATSNGLVSNQDFWNLVKPFLSNKGGLHGTDITLVKEDKIITDDRELAEVFNDHYINIVEKSSGKKPSSIAENAPSSDDRCIVRLILQQYQNHPSVLAIIRSLENPFDTFSPHEVSTEDVLRLLRAINDKKSTGEDKIPPKLVHLAARELSVPLTKAINISIRNSKFPEREKKTAVTPLDKGEPIRTVEKNFRPVSILNPFSKIYEKFVKEQISPFLEKTLSVFIAAYRKAYGAQHVLVRMLEDWKTKLDNDFTVGAILMDLSKAFDCIPHDLLIAKLHAYGFNENSLVFIYSYLKRRRQSVRINNVYSNYQSVLSGAPQGSILGPILFNFYINDLFHFIKEASLVNYADDNTLTYFSNSLPQLIDVLGKEACVALTWLDRNEMIANPEKFHALLVKKDRTDTTGHSISIQGKTIKSEASVKLLGVNLDHQLNFDLHISDLCKKAATQLNVLKRLKPFLGFAEKKVNFNYCPLVWFFSSARSMDKIEKIQERALRFLYDDHGSSYEELLGKSKKKMHNACK